MFNCNNFNFSRADNARSLNDIEASLPTEIEARETAVDEALMERAGKFLATHTVEFSMPEEVSRSLDEGIHKFTRNKILYSYFISMQRFIYIHMHIFFFFYNCFSSWQKEENRQISLANSSVIENESNGIDTNCPWCTCIGCLQGTYYWQDCSCNFWYHRSAKIIGLQASTELRCRCSSSSSRGTS